MLNVPYLENEIKNSGKSKTFLANKLGITRSAFYSKIKGRTAFSGEEFIILLIELGFSDIPEDIRNFFCNEVR